MWRAAAIAVGLVSLVACQNYGDQLQRAHGYYEEHKYEQALAVLRNLESDQDSLETAERVRYCYVRGMTDYRLGYHEDARYWLSLARASNERAKNALEADEKGRLEEALTELNAPLYGLAQSKKPGVLGEPCQWTSQCEAGFVCEDGGCVQTN